MENLYNKVYDLVKQIPIGRVSTYGEVAKALGNVRLSRQVGYALHCNPAFGEIPCHRIVNRYGKLATAFKFGGINIQKQLLESEGVCVQNNSVNLEKYLYTYRK